MLSNNPTSNLQRRRQQQQQHRRQQSLEVPIIATQIPAHQRQRSPHHAHRRGLSLDQSTSNVTSPTGFRPLHPQDQQLRPTSPLAGSHTNTGHTYPSPDRQHYVQETQQHLPSQPGFPAQDFQTHLQQQLQGGLVNVNPQQIAFQTAEDAKMQLQQHIRWFETTYGENAPSITISTAPGANAPQPDMSQVPMSPSQQDATTSMHSMQMLPGRVIHAQPQMSQHPHPYPHTVPNTPQSHAQPWSSPPQAHAKHVRSQSFQLDTAPMPATFNATHGDFILADQQAFMTQSAYPQDAFASFGSDQSYASSAYSSSIADPGSPRAFNTPHMPTVPEEPDLQGMAGPHFQQNFMGNPTTMIGAAAGAEHQDDQFLYQPQAMSPRAAALASLGGINASIEDTGISSEQVTQYMSEQDPSDSKWSCLYPECNKRFGRKENIRAHVQTHLGDRQFKCNDCGKCFVRQHDLKRHAKIHSGLKAHVCPCGMSFARQDALTRHRQRGMCFGVLPGFEKNEEDKKKRGRPRKERPDTETRVEKATRARRMDAANTASSSYNANASASPHEQTSPYGPTSPYDQENTNFANDPAVDDFLAAAEEQYASASSDSGASDCSLPVTPPDTQSDMFEDLDFSAFVDPAAVGLGNSNFNFSSGDSGSSWRNDTPPSSPPADYSSPLDDLLLSGSACADVPDYALRNGLMAFLEQGGQNTNNDFINI